MRDPRRESGERATHTSGVSEVRGDVSVTICGSGAKIIGIAKKRSGQIGSTRSVGVLLQTRR